MYAMIIFLPKMRVYAALGAALLFVTLGILPAGKIITSINWNALMMIAGTMIVVFYFIESQMPNLIADLLLDRAGNVMMVTILMSVFAGVISAFIDNVATVVMVAPVGLAICRKLNISPVPMTISIAVSSNLQGAATLVGDTTSIMLGAYANMDFLDFFYMNGKPGIFFAVELGALLTIPIMLILFRKDRDPVTVEEKTAVHDLVPTFFLSGLVIVLIAVSFFKNKPEITNGVICMAAAFVLMIYENIRTQSTEAAGYALRSVDYETLLLLTGLFIVIGGMVELGVIDRAASLIAGVGGKNLFILYTVIVWGSVLISAFIDNIPYVATMLPVISSLTHQLGIDPCLLYFGLLCGATLGGNLTPIGASANITATGILRREGYEVSFGDFARIGIPFTLAAVLGGYLFIWFVWK